MITGVETAGLVLAVFPLVVKALQSWQKGSKSIRSWRKTEQVVKQYLMRVQNQYVAFENTIELLLEDIVQSPEHLKDMLQEPCGSLWHEGSYEEQVRLRLDRSYDPFVETVAKVCIAFPLEYLPVVSVQLPT